MWNKLFYITFILTITFSSCKKQTVEYDKEKELPKDTLTFISDYSYSIINSGQVSVSVSFVTFNQLFSKTNYSNDIFNLINNNNSFTFNIQNNVELSPIKLNKYSTIVLFEKGEYSWYNDYHNVGFYFRRYLENTQNNVAVGYYETDIPNSQVQLFNKDGGSVFNNKWEDNLEDTYGVISEFNGYNLYLKDVIDKIDQTITIYSNSYSSLPNKSITTFLPSSYQFLSSDTLLITNLINRAITNGIELNFIANTSDNNLKKLAYKTGGVFINYEFENYYSNFSGDYTQTTYVDVAIENLDAILLKDYTSHQYNFTIIDANLIAFGAGTTNYFTAEYNGVKFQYIINN
jgi:hypothetical protein